MSKNKIILEGRVIKKLPDCMFLVKLSEVPETNGNDIVLTYLSGKMRKNNIRVEMGDKVKVELGLYDLSKGRIVYRG